MRQRERLEPPAELERLHEQIGRLNLRAERVTERLRDGLADGKASPDLVRAYVAERSLAIRDNRLAPELGLAECVTPLVLPGAPPAPY
jgi:hypothetical protein